MSVPIDAYDQYTSASSGDDDSTACETDARDEWRDFITGMKDGKRLIHAMIASTTSGWKVSQPDPLGYMKILHPMAAKIHSQATHPALWRCMKSHPRRIEEFATTINAKVDIESEYAKVITADDGAARWYLEDIRHAPMRSGKSEIRSRFVSLINQVSSALGIAVRSEMSVTMAVGGILVDDAYDVQGEADLCIYNSDGVCVLVLVVRSRAECDDSEWYDKCRVTETVTALFHFNAPVFLVTSRQFKLFYENIERDSIYTYPSELTEASQFMNSLRVGDLQDEFIKLLIICMKAEHVKQTRNLSDSSSGSDYQEDKSDDSHIRVTKIQPQFSFENSRGDMEILRMRLFDENEIKDFFKEGSL